MVLYEIVSRKLPYSEWNDFQACQQISNGTIPQLDGFVDAKQFCQVISKCWQSRGFQKKIGYHSIIETKISIFF